MTGHARAALLLLLAAVLLPSALPAENAPGLIGPTWLLLEAKGVAVKVPADARHPFLLFHATEKRITGYSGCNEFFGSYELKGGSLTFGPLGMTRRFCDGDAGNAESVFLQVLGETRTWKIEKGQMLLLDNSTVLARFSLAAGSATGQ